MQAGAYAKMWAPRRQGPAAQGRRHYEGPERRPPTLCAEHRARPAGLLQMARR